jgi:hypothetical protein
VKAEADEAAARAKEIAVTVNFMTEFKKLLKSCEVRDKMLV